MERPPLPSLVDVAPGDAVRVLDIDPAELDRLAAEGLAPGDRVVIEARLPLGGPIVVRVGRARLALARRVAAGVRVRPEAPVP